MYEEMYRYGWYEGPKCRGFGGAMERGGRQVALGDAPRIAILSAGSGRDLLKVGLAAGIWGTWREINPKGFPLVKPDARFFVTEFSLDNFGRLEAHVEALPEKGLLKPDMVSLRRWSFRQRVSLATESQDLGPVDVLLARRADRVPGSGLGKTKH